MEIYLNVFRTREFVHQIVCTWACACRRALTLANQATGLHCTARSYEFQGFISHRLHFSSSKTMSQSRAHADTCTQQLILHLETMASLCVARRLMLVCFSLLPVSAVDFVEHAFFFAHFQPGVIQSLEKTKIFCFEALYSLFRLVFSSLHRWCSFGLAQIRTCKQTQQPWNCDQKLNL